MSRRLARPGQWMKGGEGRVGSERGRSIWGDGQMWSWWWTSKYRLGLHWYGSGRGCGVAGSVEYS